MLFAGAYYRLHAPRGAGLIVTHPTRALRPTLFRQRMTNVVGAVDTSSTLPAIGAQQVLASSSPRP